MSINIHFKVFLWFFLAAEVALKDLKTGDIILFGGNRIVLKKNYPSVGAFLYHLTEEILWEIAIFFYVRYWYHLAMVIDRSDIPENIKLPEVYKKEEKFILESRLFHGVVLNPLRRRILDRPEYIALRRLSPALEEKHRKKIKEALTLFYGKPFANDFWEFLNAWLDFSFLPEIKTDLSALSCPEVITETMKMAGVLGNNIPSSEYTPDNFAGKSFKRRKDVECQLKIPSSDN